MPTLPLPDFLSDLQLSIAGKPLALHPVAGEDGTYAIGLTAPTSSWGLFVDVERQWAKEHDSQTVTVYEQGREHGHVRGLHDYKGTPRVFSEWLRERVTKLIHDLVRGHIGGTYYRLSKADDEDHSPDIAQLCREVAALPPLPEAPDFYGCQPICAALTAIAHGHERGAMTDEEAAAVRVVLDTYDSPPFRKELREQTVKYAFVLLPDVLPAPLSEYFEAEAAELFDRWTEGGEVTVAHLATVGVGLDHLPAHLRPLFQRLVDPKCDTPGMFFAMATGLSGNPAEAAKYATKGLELAPGHAALRRVSELLNDGASANFARAQKWAKRYEELIPEVLWERDNPDLDGNDQKLIGVEAKINNFWLSVLPPREDPRWEEAAEALCAQRRFKAQGSEAYVRWLRYHKRFDEAIEYFCQQQRNRVLTKLQHLSDYKCENYLVQSLCCMLDSQRQEHIKLALEVVAELEADLTWQSGDIYYCLACIASRARKFKRALQYAKKAVALGKKVEDMLSDPDFGKLLANSKAAAKLRALA